jgi:hypothetical protein
MMIGIGPGAPPPADRAERARSFTHRKLKEGVASCLSLPRVDFGGQDAGRRARARRRWIELLALLQRRTTNLDWGT